MLRFSEHVIYQNSSISLSEQTVKTLTLAGAAALLMRHSALSKQATSYVKNRKYIEDKLDRIADALAALNTKITALGALSWAVANKKVELPD